MIWVLAAISGLLIGCVIGAFHGYLVAYLGIPAFIVTLGGLLVWRGAAFLLARGETISPAMRLQTWRRTIWRGGGDRKLIGLRLSGGAGLAVAGPASGATHSAYLLAFGIARHCEAFIVRSR